MVKSTGTELPPSGFGAALRRVRDEKGVTQKKLGDDAGIHPNTVARLERGEVEPSWQVVLALASALGVDCAAFNEEKPAAAKKPGGKK